MGGQGQGLEGRGCWQHLGCPEWSQMADRVLLGVGVHQKRVVQVLLAKYQDDIS